METPTFFDTQSVPFCCTPRPPSDPYLWASLQSGHSSRFGVGRVPLPPNRLSLRAPRMKDKPRSVEGGPLERQYRNTHFLYK